MAQVVGVLIPKKWPKMALPSQIPIIAQNREGISPSLYGMHVEGAGQSATAFGTDLESGSSATEATGSTGTGLARQLTHSLEEWTAWLGPG